MGYSIHPNWTSGSEIRAIQILEIGRRKIYEFSVSPKTHHGLAKKEKFWVFKGARLQEINIPGCQ